MKLAMGPILYFWSRDEVFGFYRDLARLPVDIVYLGETVCSKRRTLTLADWQLLAERLANAGKEVLLSTLTLLESESELRTMRRIVNNGGFAVEANDMAAVSVAAQAGVPFVAGPHLNSYNQATLELLAELGAMRWVAPMEMSRETMVGMQERRPSGLQTELFVYGRMPLAFSARCFTARNRDLPKDECGLCCADYPEGMQLATQEGEQFLVLNGIQTQSGRICNLLREIPDLAALGVDVVRLSPRSRRMEEIVEVFHQAVTGEGVTQELYDRLVHGEREEQCNGYWFGEAGMVVRE